MPTTADDGYLLEDWLTGAPQVTLHDALRLLLDVARSLDALHREGKLHLRVRPDSIGILRGQGRPAVQLLAPHAVAPGNESLDLRYTAPELSDRTASQPDTRTDLYLLGLLAWQLLANRLPFEAEDPIGWFHAHLALHPADLRSVRSDVPAAVAELVQALLAKSPAQRPASARAVADDLQHCLEALEGTRSIQSLTLRTPHARFALPRHLVGREAEREALRKVLTRIVEGGVEVLTLGGPSGIGKSALAADLAQDAQARACLFAAGKFDQLGASRPYGALAELLESLSHELLRQRRSMPVVGPEGAALAALSPELGRAWGLRAGDSEVPPSQARQRLLYSLVRLLARLSQDQAVVLFLDDVQWGDAETLSLILGALADGELSRVLLLLAERTEDGMTPWQHETPPTIPATRVDLEPLGDSDVRRWIALALPGGLAQPATVFERLAARSGGNPLFLGQLLTTLVLQGQLLPEPGGHWRLEETPAASTSLPESTLEAISRRLHGLGLAHAELLGLAATLGSRFDADVLATVSCKTGAVIERALQQFQAAGFIEPMPEPGRWRFVHDRLQQAAYELASQEQRLLRHLRIGRALRDMNDPLQLFEACRHLDLVTDRLDEDERQALLRLNWQAARRSRASAGFAQYAALMRAALGLLPTVKIREAERTGILYDAAEALLLERDFTGSEACLAHAASLGGDALEAARAAELRIQWLIAQGRSSEALGHGLAALARFGLRVDPGRARLATIWQLARLRLVLRGRAPQSWSSAPENQDARHVQLQRLIFAILSVAHTLASPVYAVLGLIGARQSLEHGLTPWSSQPVAVAAHVLSGMFDDIDTGYALGELSVRLGERFGTHSLSFNHLFYVMHWKMPVAETLPPLRQCMEQAERSGNFEIAGYAAGMALGVTWNAMNSLLAVQQASAEVRAFSQRRGSDLASDCAETFDWLLGLLRGPDLRGPIAPLQRQRRDGRQLPHDGLFDVVHDQLSVMLNVAAGYFGDEVVACGERARRNLHRLEGNFSTPLHHWFEALLHAERLRQHHMPGSARLVRSHLRKLRRWATHCPANHAHRVASLEAEQAAIDGAIDAVARYAEAVRLARRHGFTGDAAIIAHRWARHSARTGHLEQWPQAMALAYELYAQWGATAMLRQLESSLPAFAQPRAMPTIPPDVPLDAGTLIKASHAISAERDMPAIAGRLLQQAMENAGARYGALVLEQRGRLRVAAQRTEGSCTAEEDTGVAAELTTLPQELLRIVQRTQQSVVLDDATAPHAYGTCPRWQDHAAVSVLCVPVVAAGAAVGALYLENELTAGCFTPARITLAHLLASQAAIAMANARLFGELAAAHEKLQQSNLRLEDRVAERTRELERNYHELRRLERRLAADEERQRIMGDLHDGLGSQLFVTLSKVERGEFDSRQISDALRACIADMRLVLEAMSPDSGDFLDAWGNFRFRWDAQLQGAGVVAHWRTECDGKQATLSAASALQVLRIAQEALTNVLKHAQATRVAVHLEAGHGSIRLAIADDGRGLADGPRSGRGLANMRARATRLGASLVLEAAHPGTRVVLELSAR